MLLEPEIEQRVSSSPFLGLMQRYLHIIPRVTSPASSIRQTRSSPRAAWRHVEEGAVRADRGMKHTDGLELLHCCCFFCLGATHSSNLQNTHIKCNVGPAFASPFLHHSPFL